MDSLTQIVLGAAVGEAVAGKHIGNKAAFWGAIAGTIPDLDVFFMGLFNPIDASLFHRGFSHSFLFACISGPVLGFLLHRYSKKSIELKSWILLFFLGILTHPILDMFTTYGTEFLWPLSNRIAFNTVFVIDPLYTIPFLTCLILALRIPKSNSRRFHINMAGIVYSTIYLLLGVILKLSILYFEPNLSGKVIPDRTSVAPMPLTIFYWMKIKEDKNNFYVNHVNIFHPKNEKFIDTLKKNHEMIKSNNMDKQIDIDKIEFITKGYYTVNLSKNKLEIYDLRFGVLLPLTNGKIKDPLMGYSFKFDQNNKIIKTEKHRTEALFNNLDFKNYIREIFK
jgi:inner membrane protein